MRSDSPIERRQEQRQSASLPLWWRKGSDRIAHHGWMLDVSAHGLALLATQDHCPAVGDQIDIALVNPELGLGTEIAPHLLRRATVHRLDTMTSSMRRVALHFESDLWQD